MATVHRNLFHNTGSLGFFGNTVVLDGLDMREIVIRYKISSFDKWI